MKESFECLPGRIHIKTYTWNCAVSFIALKIDFLHRNNILNVYNALRLIHSHKCSSLTSGFHNGLSFSCNNNRKLPAVSSHVFQRPLQSQWASLECGPISPQNLVTQSPASDETDDACSSRQDFFQGFAELLQFIMKCGASSENRVPSQPSGYSPPWYPVLSHVSCNCVSWGPPRPSLL